MKLALAQELGVWLDNALENLALHRERSVCVIGIIGKHALGNAGAKTDPINDFLKKSVFLGAWDNSQRQLTIDAYFDASLDTVFLNLVGVHDLQILASRFSAEPNASPSSAGEGGDFHSLLIGLEEVHVRRVLLCVLVCHAILVVEPCCRFDAQLARLMRTLNRIREETQSEVCRLLRNTHSVSRASADEGRLCTPRLLFAFHRSPIRGDISAHKRRELTEKLERSMEDQIYNIFRKSRVITNNASQSICALPVNRQPYVYIFNNQSEGLKDPMRDLVGNLWKTLEAKATSGGAAIGNEDGESTEVDTGRRNTSGRAVNDSSFDQFLRRHIDEAHEKGFMDDLKKNFDFPTSYFELPKLKTFIRMTKTLYTYIVEEPPTELKNLSRLVGVEMEFSEFRCSKVLPLAFRTYEQDLPRHYSRAQHELKLAQALQQLSCQARGPSLSAALLRLTEKCENYWLDGRQACEQLSLTANHCTNPKHLTLNSPSDDPNEKRPMMEHDSKARYLSTCNCGMKQLLRDDPYYLKEANFDFYERAEFMCCKRLERYPFPVFSPPEETELMPDEGTEAAVLSKNDEHVAAFKDEGEAPEILNTKAVGVTALIGVFDHLAVTNVHTQSELDSTKGDVVGGSTEGDFLPDRDNKMLLLLSDKKDGEVASSADDDEEALDQLVSPPPPHSSELRTNTEILSQEELILDAEGRTTGTTTDSLSAVSDLLMEDEAYLMGEHPQRRHSHDGRSEETEDDDRTSDALVEHQHHGVDDGSSSSDKWSNEGAGDVESEAQETTVTADSSSSSRLIPLDLKGKWKDTLAEAYAEYDGLYVDGMPSSVSAANLDPLFPSWSVVCLGSSSIYTHAHGLRDMPNFTHGSGYLLPWDVSLTVDVDRWQQRMDTLNALAPSATGFRGRRPVRRRDAADNNGALTEGGGSTKGTGLVSVKVFVAFEYECPRGHRFTMQTPTRPLKYIGPGGPKDPAAAVIDHDLPLWFPCSCKGTPRVNGQLQRIHCVTPKAPVSVLLTPRVQPDTADPTVFHSGARTPIQLSWAKYYVLRLPYCYRRPNGQPIYPPKQQDTFGRIFAAALTLVESDV